MAAFYLIGSYRDAWQVRRLVHRITSARPDAHVFVMRDQKAPPLLHAGCEVLTTVRPVSWGDESFLVSFLDIVKTLNLRSEDWLTFLSEQSYPLRPLCDYEHVVAASDDDSWLEQSILENPDREMLLDRYRCRFLQLPLSRFEAVHKMARRVESHTPLQFTGKTGDPLRVRVPRRTPFRNGVELRMGSDWYVLKGTAVKRLFQPDARELLRYFCRTPHPAEAYVHTVILNDPRLKNCPQRSHFLDFDGAHPRVLGHDDVPRLLESGDWFARKFEDPSVLDALDRATS